MRNGYENEEDRHVHQPVLLAEAVAAMAPASGGIYADLTIGAGGHAEAVLGQSSPDGIVHGLDRDPEILEVAGRRLARFRGRVQLHRGNFSEADVILQELQGRIDAVLFDLGFSSLQIEQPARGFSLKQDGPLDMRMDPDASLTAEQLLNEAPREALLRAVAELGEEPRARAVVQAIMLERRRRRLTRTTDLKEIVERVYGRRGGRIHPATRTFQGIRMAVNDELENLERGLGAAYRLLKPGGRLAVIVFHGGEARKVKDFIRARRAAGEMTPAGGGAIKPSAEEIRRNRRSRSSRLRVAIKTA